MSPTYFWSSCGCVSLITLLAGCSNDTVSLGGGRPPQEVQPGERCSGSSSVQGPVTVHDQNELAELAGCEQVDGDLHIEIFAGADLTPLSALRVVDGLLEIGAYPDISQVDDLGALKKRVNQIIADGYLPSLEGLEKLERVSGLEIDAISAEDLDPLVGLRQLNGREGSLPMGWLGVQSAANLRDLHGLSNIESVEWLVLNGNPALTSLGGISINGSPASIDLIDLPLLTSIDELQPVEGMSSLHLSNLGITDLEGLVNLGYVDDIALTENSQLVNVDRLAQMTTSALLVLHNAVLEAIPPLQRMSGLQTLTVKQNPRLKSLHVDLPPSPQGPDYLEGAVLTDPIKLFDIGQNDELTTISLTAGLENGRLLAIYDNPALVQVSIGTLKRLEELDISSNANLEQIALGALQTVDQLSVFNNPKFDVTQLGTVRTFTSQVSRNAASAPPP